MVRGGLGGQRVPLPPHPSTPPHCLACSELSTSYLPLSGSPLWSVPPDLALYQPMMWPVASPHPHSWPSSVQANATCTLFLSGLWPTVTGSHGSTSDVAGRWLVSFLGWDREVCVDIARGQPQMGGLGHQARLACMGARGIEDSPIPMCPARQWWPPPPNTPAPRLSPQQPCQPSPHSIHVPILGLGMCHHLLGQCPALQSSQGLRPSIGHYHRGLLGLLGL